MLVEHAPKDASALLPTVQLLAQLSAAQLGWVAPKHQAVLAWCAESTLADGDRRQTCGDLAEVLAGKSATVLEQAAGAAIGKRVGWSEARLEALKKERDAYAAADPAGGAEALSCDWARRQLAHARAVAQGGELAAGREVLLRETTAKASSPVTTR
jgi:hypothetical protein